MTTAMPGSEKFANRPLPPNEVRDRVAGLVPLHEIDADALAAVDPLTYEVIRYRLNAITQQSGDAIKRMSGSIIVTDCNDFDFAVMNEVGEQVQVGLFNTQLVAAMDMAVQWTLIHRSENPGIGEGDVFLCNDPYVGGGLHQNDVSLFAPLFWNGELFSWTCAVAHQADLGGLAPGSRSVDARDVFAESLPTPPVKIVEGGRIRSDIEDLYLRRSRVPHLVALDLRAKMGGIRLAQEALGRLIDKYGPTVVKAVMRRMLDDAETRLRNKLSALPDGEWRAVTYEDSSRRGDRDVYRISLTLSKRDDRLCFDFTGTDPQVDGFINCTHAGLRGGIMPAVLTLLCGDIPWSPGGFTRCFDVISTPGSINDCLYPAAVGKASIGSAWATQNVVTECVSRMLDVHPVQRETVMSVCMGTWDSAVLSGIDQRGRYFTGSVGDAMAGGLGARTDQDGVDTGGLACIPMGRIADAEINEFNFPLLYLWRREQPDTGGAGRYRGGVGGSSCFVLHDAQRGEIDLLVTGGGKAIPQAVGLSGAFPAGTQHDVLIRHSDIADALASGRVPQSVDDIGGSAELMPQHTTIVFGESDVYCMQWPGGGGYGDPLQRDPESVERDLRAGKISATAARDVYGAVITGDGLDLDRTEQLRAEKLIQRMEGRR